MNLIHKEYETDQHLAAKLKKDHSHKLPRAVTDNAKRKSETARIEKNQVANSEGTELSSFLQNPEKKPGFWKRIFRRKSGKKS